VRWNDGQIGCNGRLATGGRYHSLRVFYTVPLTALTCKDD
jgi:hypothetical protein